VRRLSGPFEGVGLVDWPRLDLAECGIISSMETGKSGSVLPQVPEYSRARPDRARGYLEQTAAELANYQFGLGDRPDYTEVIGRYLFSVAAVAQETEQPLTRRNVVEISRKALELVPIAQREHVNRVQADIAKRGHAIGAITWSRLQETTPSADASGQAEDLHKPDVLTADKFRYLDVLDVWTEGWLVYRRPKVGAGR
jgi:hypothetical protein